MGFVNEYTSKEDVIKFGILDLKNKYLPKNIQYESIDDRNVKNFDWAIDRERFGLHICLLDWKIEW